MMNAQGNNIINGNCWIAYLDILGFENILRYTREKTGSDNLDFVARWCHKQVIRDIERKRNEQKTYTDIEMYYFCLSDSFVFFSPDDSLNSFLGMSWVAKELPVRLISYQIPFRGSLTVGKFFAEIKENIFIGQGLIDAYKYAEKQNWIGLVLTPTAIDKLFQINADSAQNLKDYVEYDVPIKARDKHCENKIVYNYSTEKLFTFKLHKFPEVRERIEELYEKAKASSAGSDVIRKYENTLKFFNSIK